MAKRFSAIANRAARFRTSVSNWVAVKRVSLTLKFGVGFTALLLSIKQVLVETKIAVGLLVSLQQRSVQILRASIAVDFLSSLGKRASTVCKAGVAIGFCAVAWVKAIAKMFVCLRVGFSAEAQRRRLLKSVGKIGVGFTSVCNSLGTLRFDNWRQTARTLGGLKKLDLGDYGEMTLGEMKYTERYAPLFIVRFDADLQKGRAA